MHRDSKEREEYRAEDQGGRKKIKNLPAKMSGYRRMFV